MAKSGQFHLGISLSLEYQNIEKKWSKSGPHVAGLPPTARFGKSIESVKFIVRGSQHARGGSDDDGIQSPHVIKRSECDFQLLQGCLHVPAVVCRG